MDSEEGSVSGARSGTQATEHGGVPTEAAEASPGCGESSVGGRGSKRRVKISAVMASSMAQSGGSARVLRTRGAAAGTGSQPRSAKPQKKPAGVQRNRGRPADCRLKNTPVTQAATAKKPTSKKGSKRAPPGPKLSKSRKGSGKPPAAAPSVAAPCKDEAGAETSGDRTAASKESDSIPETDGVPPDKGSPLREDHGDVISKPLAKTQRSKGQTSMQQKDVKTEESEKEEGENDIKQEEAPEVVMRGEAQVEVETETPKKRGRQKDDKAARPPKRRKKPPVQYVRCEMEGCGTVLAHPRYLQHHIKYQHLLKKKYVCDYPSCGRLFRLQKQLFRHAKHHTDQRDYICEYCARAFKSSHNLAVHRMIHTGEKPIQCEICGFTCRQKASLNWHMKKHDAEASYQFSCSICNKKFEKKDSVVAHKAKSHPEVLIAEAMAANGGSVITTSVTETIAETAVETQESVPVLTPPPAAATSEPQEEAAAAGALTPLQQVVLAPPPQPSPPQGQFLQLPSHHVVQVQQQAPAFLQLSAATPPNPGTQLIQLAAAPPIPATYPQGTLFTLTSVAALAPQQSVQWERTGAEEKDCEMPGEGELWDRVVVGAEEQAVGDMMWEGNGERRREDEGIAW